MGCNDHDDVPQVTRTTVVPADADTVWSAVSDAAELEAWLAPSVELDITPGATGRVVDDDGVERTVEVDEVEVGRRVAMRWWPAARPHDVSRVEIELVPCVSHTVVTVTETRLVPVARASASASAGAGWTGRVLALAFVAGVSTLVRA